MAEDNLPGRQAVEVGQDLSGYGGVDEEEGQARRSVGDGGDANAGERVRALGGH